jgi:glycosyltransferase involved in cell wall biosynthesis
MTTDTVGGVWTYALDLARGLARAEIETLLVVLGPAPTADQTTEAYGIQRLSLIETGLPLDWTASEPAEILEVGAAIRGLARGGRADLVHLNSPALASGGGFSAPVVGACHSCLATWWSAVKRGPMPPDFRWRTQMTWQGMLACDALVAPTRAFAREVGQAYEIPAPHVVWNGREAADAPPPSSPREALVLTAGRLWDEGKNIAVLDQAAGLCAAPVHAAGPLEGPNGAAAQLRHADPLGRLSAQEMSAWLARAPVYASSALYEPFGLGVLEAAQAGCALVLSEIPTLRELWHGAAVFIDPRDPVAYARTFDRLLEEEAERRSLASRARARAQRYGAAQMSAGVLDLYARLQPRLARAARREVAA